jgi:hypothetical protein
MTISSARNGTLPACAHFNDVMMTVTSAVNAYRRMARHGYNAIPASARLGR